MSEATERGRQAHNVAFDMEMTRRAIGDKHPEPVREEIEIAVATRKGLDDWCRRHGYEMEQLPVVGPHECRESTVCRCRMDADEPDDRCPVHGMGMYPPKCAECGRYMRRTREVYRGS